MIFGSWNHFKQRPTQTTIHHGAPQAPGAWWWVVPSSNVGWSSTSGARKLISGKNRVKISQSELRISGNIRNSFRPDLECETEENREEISEGLPPLCCHGYQGPEGELSSHLGGGQGRRSRGLSPPCFRWRRSATRACHQAQACHGVSCPPRTLVGAILRVQGSFYPEKIV